MYTRLMTYPGEVHFIIESMCASAATLPCMAADGKKRKCSISPVAQMLIHNASIEAQGDYHVMDAASELLKKTNRSIAQAYMRRTGQSEAETFAVMDAETFFTAQEALEYGFVDHIITRANLNGGKGASK